MVYSIRTKGIFLSLSLVLVLASLLPSKAFAVEGESITASPATHRASVAAGGRISHKITIINTGTTAYNYNVEAKPFSVTNEDYKQSFKLPSNTVDTSKWITFSSTRFSLKAGERVEVPYTIAVPQNTAPGGHYAVIFATTQPPQPTSSVVSQKRVGTILYLTVDGVLEKSGKVESWSSQKWQTSPPFLSTLRMRNSGNVHFDADVDVRISDVFGNIKASPSGTAIILPQTIRKMDLTWDKAPAFGLFKVSGSVSYLGKTEPLPPHYVLMMSATFFLAMVGAVALLAAILLARRRSSGVRRR